ncbi:pyridoxamine 5'-phosphate oxidase family protein [uncultured Amnibacterium sp.]|uniref:pyridoxamine 5'-phosphate oxidase family protein n=1 Tax=uncultured Amnibacterium sp. TaxID=1631851 RepID=UPI0035CC0145
MSTSTMQLEFGDIRTLTVALGPMTTFASVDTDGTPHIIPVIPAWVGDALVFATHAMSHKVKNLRSRPKASMQFLTPGEAFPNALLMKGITRIIEGDERATLWDSGSFPWLPMMYSGSDDAMLRFVEFTPTRATVVRDGGRGPVERWRAQHS